MNETVEIDLREIGRLLLKRAWLIVLCAVMLGGFALAYTVNFVTPMYQATTTLYVNNNTEYENSSNKVNSTDLAVALRLVNSYVDIVRREVVMSAVIDKLQMNISPAALRGMVSAQVQGETEIFSVTVTSPNPQMSADVANAIADVAPGIISGIISGSQAKVIDYARVPGGRSSPNYSSSAVLGALIGAALAILVIILADRMDVRLKSEEDLEKLSGVPVLGVIPDFAEDRKPVKKVRSEK